MRGGMRYGSVVVLVASLAMAGAARGQSGTWAATGSLADGRTEHVAVKLADGRVLVAGGVNATWTGALASAEVYDPASGTWSSTGSMSVPRMFPSAVLLADGRVLVVGGGFGSGATAEIWDPATGAFTSTPAMNADRAFTTATLLADGRVLVTGGRDSSGLSSAEVFDPAGPSWTAVGSMSSIRWSHAAVRLADGRVLVAGGADGSGGVGRSATSDLWDPATGTFSAGPALSTGRSQQSMTRLADGRILIAGGIFIGLEAVGADLFDPAAGTMTAVPMAQARYAHDAALLADGRVLVVGGVNSPPATTLAGCEVFDPATGAFSAEASLPAGRMHGLLATLPDGSVLCVAGNQSAVSVAITATCLRFTPATPPNGAPTADAGDDATVEATGPGGATVALDGTGSSDPDGDGLSYTWTGDFGTASGATPAVTLALGLHTVTLTVDDGNGHVVSDTVEITVVDTTEPEIASASATPGVLWPPNHKMVPVTIALSASDAVDPALSASILSVTSNEPVDGVGDGAASPDWELTGGLTLKLRAERSGTGQGRIYTVTLLVSDASGNSSTQAVTVTVPKHKP